MVAVVTLSIGYDRISSLTHPLFREYAKKIGADFIVIDKKEVCQSNVYFNKFFVKQLLEKYDRIFFIDSDCILNNCPDVFEIVPEDCFGIYNECNDLDRNIDNYQTINYWMKECIAKYNFDIRWNISRSIQERTPYYNTGVMVFGRQHIDLFTLPNPMIKLEADHTEQSYLNCRILESKTRVFDLGYKFNRITKIKTIEEDIFDSYIIHYAGVMENRYEIMKADYENFTTNT